MKLNKISLGKGQSHSRANGIMWPWNVIIPPYELQIQIFIYEVLQYLVDKNVMTYQNIWSEGMVRPHLVESRQCKILVPLKGTWSINYFLHKKCFLLVAAIQKRISKILKLTNISREKGQSDLWKNGVMWSQFTSYATNLKFLQMKSYNL